VIKRLFWLTMGFGLGVWFTVRSTTKVRGAVERYVPEPVMERLRDVNAAVEERQALIHARNVGARRDKRQERATAGARARIA